ncbi:MAG: helix-hairpin-helix domain-containing protein, partial [Ketobacter sp.]
MRMVRVFVLLCGLGMLLPCAAFCADKNQYFIPLPININTADELTLSRALVGIGPKKAAAIVAFRNQH